VKAWSEGAESHDERLWVKALVLESGETPFILLTIDSLWISGRMRACAVDAARLAGVPEANVMVAASHTHSGPQTLRVGNAMKAPHDEGYLKQVEGIIGDVVRDSLVADPEEVTARYAEGRYAGSVKRLKVVLSLTRTGIVGRRMKFLPDPDGPGDPVVRALGFYRNDSSAAAVMFGYSCHPTVLNGPGLSRDYPGAASDTIADRTGAEPFFMLGFCGDLRPYITDSWAQVLASPGKWLVVLNNRTRPFRYGTRDEMIRFGRDIGSVAVDSLAAGGRPVALDSLGARMIAVDVPLRDGSTVPLSLQRVDLGDGPTLLGVGAEVFQEFRGAAARKFDRDDIWPVGLANGVVGYLHPESVVPYRPYGMDLSLRDDVGVLDRAHEKAVLEGFEALNSDPEAP